MSASNTAHFWRDRPVLITGATGLVGSRLVSYLLGEGAQVVCLMRDWVPESELVLSGDHLRAIIVRGELCDRDTLERTLGEYEINTVFHLAAQTIVGTANANPLSTFESNIRGTWLLLEACRRSPRVKSIVIASSDKAYGDQTKLPYSEETPLQGTHPYDVSKSCADLIAHSYAVSYDLPVAITRCGNIFGGGDLNWNRVVPGTIRSLIRGTQPVIRSDGLCVRDYFYVDDAVEAYALLAEHLSSNPSLHGEAFNFSYDQPMTVLEIVDKITKQMGKQEKPVILNEFSNEILKQYLSSAKAQKMLNWKPRHSFELGLTKTIDWYKKLLAD